MSSLPSLLDGFSNSSSLKKYFTNVHNLRERARALLEEGYNDKGFYVSTKLDCLKTNSKWLVGIDSKVNTVGYPFCYWDLSTHVEYNHSRVWKSSLNILIDNKPNVSGDLCLDLLDSTKVIAGFEAPSFKSMKLEFLYVKEHISLSLKASGFEKNRWSDYCNQHQKVREKELIASRKVFSILPKKYDVSAALYGSFLKIAGECSYVLDSGQFMNSALINWCVGGVMETKDFMASIICSRHSLTGSFVQRLSWMSLGIPEFDLGFEISKRISSDEYTATLGACFKSNTNHMYKGKINQLGEISGCVEAKLWCDAVVSFSGQLDLKRLFERPSPKLLPKPPTKKKLPSISEACCWWRKMIQVAIMCLGAGVIMGLNDLCRKTSSLYLGRSLYLNEATLVGDLKELEQFLEEKQLGYLVAVYGTVGSTESVKSKHMKSGGAVFVKETATLVFRRKMEVGSALDHESILVGCKEVPWYLDDGTARVNIMKYQEAQGFTDFLDTYRSTAPVKQHFEKLASMEEITIPKDGNYCEVWEQVLPFGTDLTVIGRVDRDKDGTPTITEAYQFFEGRIQPQQKDSYLESDSVFCQNVSKVLTVIGMVLLGRSLLQNFCR